jgi:2-oxoglutarate dehydrogenase E1 component
VNQGLVEELFLKYRENPSSVSESWRAYFDALDEDPIPRRRTSAGVTSPGHLTSPGLVAPLTESSTGALRATRHSFPPTRENQTATELQSGVSALVNAYRVRGHLFANLDPLGLSPKPAMDLDLASFGLGDVDPGTIFRAMGKHMPLGEIVAHLSETYCRSIGAEITQVEEKEERDWLQTQMESNRNHVALSRDQQLQILGKLTEAEVWETFVHTAYKGKKRFSLEGAEATVPLLELLIDGASQHGVEEVCIGMAHRGRLNVLLNVMELSPLDMLAAFEDHNAEKYLGRGDVKYHLGYSSDRVFSGKKVHLTLSFNPSHLEFVNPVVTGRVRAKQDRRGDVERKRVLPLLIHGDAAVIGQGVVAETLNLAYLPAYTTGGTVHVVINNQVGYTTNPEEARSSRYCTDLMRMLRCPVLHVNGEDPEAVAQVAKVASEYRQRYSRDVCIDLYCYRKYGHNEGDEPRFTQPLMYKAIDAKEPPRKVYVNRLVARGQITEADADALVVDRKKRLTDALDEVRRTKRTFEVTAMTGLWTPFRGGPDARVPDVPTSERTRSGHCSGRSGRFPQTSLSCARPPPIGSATSMRPPESPSPGRSPRTWRTRRSWCAGTPCGSRGRTAGAGRSATGRRSCTTARPGGRTRRSTTSGPRSAGGKRASTSTTARSAKRACSASSGATASTARTASWCGRRSSATSRTPRR